VPALELVLSCEHGGNRVPREYAAHFAGAGKLLDSHAAFDLGALAVASRICAALGAPLVSSTTTRLLVDLNRSPHHPRLHSRFTAGLAPAIKKQILETYYIPHRERVRDLVAVAIARRSIVVHVAVHSFAPSIDGNVRLADVGLLYDPARGGEVAFCRGWRAEICARSEARVRRNYPYRGNADGLTTHLRRIFPNGAYRGIELELNQKLLGAGNRRGRAIVTATIEGLRQTLAQAGWAR